jgi:acetoacetate decarboxylase
MGFVKTVEEVARISAVLKEARFVGSEMLSVDFLTSPQTVLGVLPPGFEPAAEPLMTAMVGRWRSNCVGDYCGGALYVMARYQGIEAPYVLCMYMDTEPALMYGREILGEPKKRATSNLYRRGSSMHGYIERNGVRLIDIRAQLGRDIGPGKVSGANFNIKATPDPSGTTCQDDAAVTLAEFNNVLTTRREGEGTLVLRSSPLDPCADIDIVRIKGAAYVEGDLMAHAKTIGRIDKDRFFPYLLGRMDNWSLFDTERDIAVG